MNIVVTGAAQGIGREIAFKFASEGYEVIIADISDSGKKTADEISKTGKAMFVKADISDEDDVKRIFAGIKSLDVLVNNAAISRAYSEPLEKLSLKDWNRVISVNLTGAMLCAKHAAPLLRRAKGSIINIASTRALMSEKNSEAYAASKGGIVALTHALAVSLGPEIRANCISPGWINTKAEKLSEEDNLQHPCGRVGNASDIADLAFFIAKAGFITGQNIIADGGMTRRMIYH